MKCKNCSSEVYCRGLCSKCYRKEYRSSPEVIKRKKESDKEYYNRPEIKERKKLYMKEYYKRPDVIERKKEYVKKYNKSPKAKQKQKEYRKSPEVIERNKIKYRLKTLERKYICEVRSTRVQREIEMLRKLLREYYEM